jgi:hypothetical protein
MATFGALLMDLPTLGAFTPHYFRALWWKLSWEPRYRFSAGELAISHKCWVEFDRWPIRRLMYRLDILLDIVSLDIVRFDAFCIPLSWKKHLVIVLCRQRLAHFIWWMCRF